MWEAYLAPEWTRVRMDRREAIRYVTGKDAASRSSRRQHPGEPRRDQGTPRSVHRVPARGGATLTGYGRSFSNLST